jgi:CxxC motif-containing protein
VRSTTAIPKDLIFPILELIHAKKPDKPVASGDVIIENVLDTGADIIATDHLKQI